MITINKQKLEALIEREQKQADALPSHTMDWYIYTNRVTLLNEVLELTSEVTENSVKKQKEKKEDESSSK